MALSFSTQLTIIPKLSKILEDNFKFKRMIKEEEEEGKVFQPFFQTLLQLVSNSKNSILNQVTKLYFFM